MIKYRSAFYMFISALVVMLIMVSCSTDQEHSHDDGQLWTCGMHPEVILDQPGQCPKCGMNLVPLNKQDTATVSEPMNTTAKPDGERKILYWQAPMNPSEIYDKPGKSAMGMDLVPVYEDQVNAGPTVVIDPTTVQNMGVRSSVVKRSDFSRSIRTVGKLGYNEERTYVVTSKISGWIEKLYVDYTGQKVNRGQSLMEIYSPDLVTTQQEYLLALKNKELTGDTKFNDIRDGAQSLLQSTRQRLLYWDIPESAINELEQSGTVKKSLVLPSPASGIVTHKNAVQGSYVTQGAPLFQIADISTVWVMASIYDTDLPWIRTGQEAEIELSYLPGKKISGHVSYIYPYVDEKARDVKVRIEFPNPGLDLRPGMFANVSLKTETIKNALVINSGSIIHSGRRNVVFIVKDKGHFEPREITVGEEGDGGMVRVLTGLNENDQIVTSAQFLLDSESRLQGVIQKMLAERSAK